jgi:hypothetical protein
MVRAAIVHHETCWPDRDGPWKIRVGLGVVAGRVELVSFAIVPVDEQPSRPLPRSIKRLPLGPLIDEAARACGGELAELTSAQVSRRSTMIEIESDTDQTRIGRPPVALSQIVELAQIYVAEPRRPTCAVAEYFGVHNSTAVKWVRRARELGLLTPPPPAGAAANRPRPLDPAR